MHTARNTTRPSRTTEPGAASAGVAAAAAPAEAAPAEGDADGGSPPPSTAAAAPLCEQCGAAASKYRCPGCSRRSCSLACVNAHKAQHGCSGKRDRTAYVPLKEFGDREVMSGEAWCLPGRGGHVG